MNVKCLTFALVVASGILGANAQSMKTLTVNADEIKAQVAHTMYGIFFEDINMAADGGVYAELVKNRSFEFSPNLTGWSEHFKEGNMGKLTVISRAQERPENPHIINISLPDATGAYGLSNEGFRGMGITRGERYSFSVLARLHQGSNVKLNIELVNPEGKVIGKAYLSPDELNWKKYNVKFKANATANKARLYVWIKGEGSIDMDMLSLFPEHTWKNRPGGLRADLVQKLYDLKPGFLRFPGGCIVEGRELATRYQWKKTIGDVDKRESIVNRWNTEFKHRLTSDYYQTFGLGFMEYFLTAEDIGAEPLPILNCGMACQFNTGEKASLDQLDPYVQDALDLIEFANGPVNSTWGKLRANLGHPEPFNLKLMGIGNENWGEEYVERWKIFNAAIKQKYPYMRLVSSVGTDPSGARFDYLNNTFGKLNADILDEHYYRSPKWFLENAARYDNYDRKGPKIFAGEYAAQSVAIASPLNKNNWECALAEAAFMTGLERNADVVHMASYAPLFAHVDGWQWTPDLIWFDNLGSYATPNYFVQQLYSLYKGTDVVPITMNNQALTGQDGLYATAVRDSKTSELIIKIVNTNPREQSTDIRVNYLKGIDSEGELIILQNDDLQMVNSLAHPSALSPEKQKFSLKNQHINLSFKPYSFNVIKFKLKP